MKPIGYINSFGTPAEANATQGQTANFDLINQQQIMWL